MLDKITQKLWNILNPNDEDNSRAASLNEKDIIDIFRSDSLSDILPYRVFDDRDSLFFNSNSVGFVLYLPTLLSANDEIQKKFDQLFSDSLPRGSNLQFLLFADNEINPKLDQWVLPRGYSGGVFSKMAVNRAEYIKKQSSNPNGIAPPRLFQLFISYSQPLSGLISNIEKQKIISLRTSMMTTLSDIFGVKPYMLGAEDLLNLVFSLLNKLDEEKPVYNELEPLNQQMIATNNMITVEEDCLFLGEKEEFISAFSVRKWPRDWALGLMDYFIGEDGRDSSQIVTPFCISYSVHIDDDSSLRSKLQSKAENVDTIANSKASKWRPGIKEEAAEWHFFNQKFEEGERIVKTRLQVVLKGGLSKQFEAEEKTKALFRAKGWTLTKDKYLQLHSLMSVLPMSWGSGYFQESQIFKKAKTTLSHEPSNVLPVIAEWNGTRSPGMLLTGRRGQVFFWDWFDNPQGNYNVSIVGSSGSGKSVFMQEMMVSLIGKGGRVFAIDSGRSFIKTSQTIGGDFVEFSPESSISLNPFSLIPLDERELMKQYVAMIKNIVALMASPNRELENFQLSAIEQAIFSCLEAKGNDTEISDVINELASSDSEIIRNIGINLFSYGRDGVYGKFFTGPCNLSLDASMLVFEMDELEDMKDLREVVVQLLIFRVTKEVYLGDRKTPTALVIDEAWKMLRGKRSGEFIEAAARMLRKYNGSLIVATQNIDDFFGNPATKACFDCSDWTVYLSMKEDTVSLMKKHLDINSHLENQLKTLRMVGGKYSEAMIKGPSVYAVGRLQLDPYSRILYSTKADEINAVRHYVEHGMSMEEAIEAVAADIFPSELIKKNGRINKHSNQFTVKENKSKAA